MLMAMLVMSRLPMHLCCHLICWYPTLAATSGVVSLLVLVEVWRSLQVLVFTLHWIAADAKLVIVVLLHSSHVENAIPLYVTLAVGAAIYVLALCIVLIVCKDAGS